MVFGVLIPFRVLVNIQCRYQYEKMLDFNAFPVNIHLISGQCSFSHLMHPDWSIQISGAPAICKARHPRHPGHPWNPGHPANLGYQGNTAHRCHLHHPSSLRRPGTLCTSSYCFSFFLLFIAFFIHLDS